MHTWRGHWGNLHVSSLSKPFTSKSVLLYLGLLAWILVGPRELSGPLFPALWRFLSEAVAFALPVWQFPSPTFPSTYGCSFSGACLYTCVGVCLCMSPRPCEASKCRQQREKEFTATSNGKLKISLHEYFLYKQFEIYLPNRKYMCVWWEATINFRPCLCLSLYVSPLMNWHLVQGVAHISL